MIHLLWILLPIYCSVCRLMNWSNNSLNLDKFSVFLWRNSALQLWSLSCQIQPRVTSHTAGNQLVMMYWLHTLMITHSDVCVCFRPWWRPCPAEETCWWTSVRHTTAGSLPSSRSVWGRWVSGWRWTGPPSTTRRRGGRRTTPSLPTSGGFSFGLRTFGSQWPTRLNQLVDHVFDI